MGSRKEKKAQVDTLLRREFDFFAEGTPRTKGSSFSFVNPKTGKIVFVHDNKHLKSWDLEVKIAAKEAGCLPTLGPVKLEIIYVLSRPKFHFDKSGKLRAGMPEFPLARPDVDKMERAILDALTGTAYRNDSQVVKVDHGKIYANMSMPTTGAYIVVRQI